MKHSTKTTVLLVLLAAMVNSMFLGTAQYLTFLVSFTGVSSFMTPEYFTDSGV